MPGSQAYYDTNRSNWDERAVIHASDEAGFYGLDRLMAGEILLMPIEAREVGDVSGLRIAHFQCHIGTDTLSLKRLGASQVVGLDFSPAAIENAQELARRTKIEGHFVEGSVYEAGQLLGADFDLVFTSWGTITWLDNLDAWARAAAAVLRPGGAFYFVDSHPTAQMFDDDGSGQLRLTFEYDTPASEPLLFEESTSYDGSATSIQNNKTFEWNHSASSVLNALINAGFRIDFVNEHNAIAWQLFATLEECGDRLFRFPASRPQLPLAWSIRATKTTRHVD